MDTQLMTFTTHGYYHDNSQISGELFITLTANKKNKYSIEISFMCSGLGYPECIEQWDEIPTFNKAILRYKSLKRKYFAPLCATTEHITVICKQALVVSL